MILQRILGAISVDRFRDSGTRAFAVEPDTDLGDLADGDDYRDGESRGDRGRGGTKMEVEHDEGGKEGEERYGAAIEDNGAKVLVSKLLSFLLSSEAFGEGGLEGTYAVEARVRPFSFAAYSRGAWARALP